MQRLTLSLMAVLVFSIGFLEEADANNELQTRGSNPVMSLSADRSDSSEENREIVNVTLTLSEPAPLFNTRGCMDISGTAYEPPADVGLMNVTVNNGIICSPFMSAGETQAVFTVRARDDTIIEGTETVTFVLQSQGTTPGYDLDTSPVNIDVIDDDFATEVSLSSDINQIGEAGTPEAIVTATLSQAVPNFTEICVTPSGTAHPADALLVGSNGLFDECENIPAGDTQVSFTVRGRVDTQVEPPEVFTITLDDRSGPNVVLVGSPVDITVIDDDVAADIELVSNDASISEQGLTTATITARLSNPVNNLTTFCIDATIDPDVDEFPDVRLEGLTFVDCAAIPAGATELSFTAQAKSDTEVEPTETLRLELVPNNGSTQTGPNMTIVGEPVLIDIIDDDIAADISLSVDLNSLTEGDPSVATVTATLSQPVNNFTTFCVDATGDAFPNDVQVSVDLGNFCYRIVAGETTGSFEVAAIQDGQDEPLETVTFALRANGTGPNMTLTGSPVSIDVIDEILDSLFADRFEFGTRISTPTESAKTDQ